MTCEEALDLLVAYLYGELDEGRAQAVRSHMGQCPACAAQLDGLARIRGLLSSRKDPAPSQLVIQRLVARAREETSQPRAAWGAGWLRAAIPLCFVLAVGGWIFLHHGGYTGPQERRASPPHEDLLEVSPRPEVGVGGGDISRAVQGVAQGEGEVSWSPEPEVRPSEAEDKAGAAPAVRPAPRRRATLPSRGVPPPEPPEVGQKARPEPEGRVADISDYGSASKARLESPSGEARKGWPQTEAKGAAQAPPPGFLAGQGLPDGLSQAQVLLRSGQFVAAEDAFSQVLQELRPGDPRIPLALLGLAEAKERLGKAEEAVALYARVVQEFPGYRDTALQRIKAMGGPGADPP